MPHALSPESLRTGLAALTLAKFRPKHGRLVMPDVCCDLVWSRGQLALTGPMTRAVGSRHVGEEVTLLRLSPVVAYRWLGTPLHYFTDRAVALADVDPRKARELDELEERGLLGELVRPGAITCAGIDRRVVGAAAALLHETSVGTVASMVGVSERQLERLFTDYLGLRPKTFARILRFRRAMGAAKAGAPLAAAAAAAGYADQAHFSRDACALAGASPRSIMQHVGNVQDIVAGTM